VHDERCVVGGEFADRVGQQAGPEPVPQRDPASDEIVQPVHGPILRPAPAR
jgi:hypothetical protein